jgi:tetratricopeptide (TPR) repeat protein
MLETLRAFGASRLAEAGEQPAVAAKLAGYALQVAEQTAEGMQTSAGEPAAARWLDAEDATMQQALAWALEHQPSVAVRLAPALAPWWITRGRATAGYAVLRAAAEHADPAEPADDAWPTAQYWLGYLANLAGDFLGALKHYALAIKAVADDPRSPVLVDATSGRANCLLNLGRTAEAAEEAGQAVELAQIVGGLMAVSLGVTAKSSGGPASKDARLDGAVKKLRTASKPLLQVLDPETQAAVRGDESA